MTIPYNLTTLVLKDEPLLKALIQAADPSYKRLKASVTVTDKVELQGTYWSGGSRSTYTAVNIQTRAASSAQQYAPAQFGGPAEAPTVALPPGAVIVETGFFCGKVSTASVYVHPQDAANTIKALAAMPELAGVRQYLLEAA